MAESSPASFAYVLQADALAKSKAEAIAKLAACGRDWIVLDTTFSSDEPWTAADWAAITLSTVRAHLHTVYQKLPSGRAPRRW